MALNFEIKKNSKGKVSGVIFTKGNSSLSISKYGKFSKFSFGPNNVVLTSDSPLRFKLKKQINPNFLTEQISAEKLEIAEKFIDDMNRLLPTINNILKTEKSRTKA